MLKIKIKDAFISIKNGANIKQDKSSGGIPITRIETIVNNKIDIERLGYADIKDNSFQDYYLRDGDILMSHINSISHLGKVALFDDLKLKVIHGMNLLCLRSNEEIIFPKYAYYYFRTPFFLNSIKKITKKSVNQASINISNLENLTITIPENLADQIRIAEVLTKVETLIQQRKESIDLLDDLLRSTFSHMFGDPFTNEKRWEKDYFENLVAENCPLTYGIVQPGADFPNGIPIIRPVDITKPQIDKNSLKLIDPKISNKFKRTLLNGGEILMCVRGVTGVVTLVSNELAGCNVTRGIVPIWFSSNFNKLFAYNLLKTQAVNNQIQKLTYGATLRQINLSDLRKIKLINPPISLQNKFASIVEKAEKVREQYKESLKELENLFGSLIQKSFEGELDLSKLDVSAQIREIEKKIEAESGLNISLETKLTKSMQQFIKQTADIQKRLALVNNMIPKSLFKQIESINKSIEPFQNLNKIPEQLALAMKSFDGIKSITSQLNQEAQEQFKSKLTWEEVNFEMVANWIKEEYSEYHFNSEILMQFLENERVTFSNYHSSEELKTNPKLNEADDIKSFVFSALKGKNQFIKLEQFFYDAVSENVQLKLRSDDYEIIKDKEKELRSGIYFKVVE